MSYPNPATPDGAFLTSDGGDEVDFSKAAVNVITLADIPPVFRIGDSGRKECVPGKRLTLIQSSWGTRLSDLTEPVGGVLGLMVCRGHAFTEESVASISASVESIVGADKRQCLRWGGDALLIAFKNMADYKSLGDKFISGQLDSCNITEIKGASFINAPQCFVEVLSPPGKGTDFQSVLNTVVSQFSGAFTQATILETDDYPAPSSEKCLTQVLKGDVPALAITLMFTVRAQNLAVKAKTALSKSPWKQVTFPAPLQDEIGFDTEFFVHTQLPLPMVALKTGAPGPGVQITRLLQSKDSFDSVVKLYGDTLKGAAAIRGGASASGVLSKKFPVSSSSELVVAYLPGLKPTKVDATRLCFQGHGDRGAEEVMHDAEGNQFVVLSPYK